MSVAAPAVPVGNHEQKYSAGNPISKFLVNGFLSAFDDLVAMAGPSSVHEVGCGEGELLRRFVTTPVRQAKGTDISAEVFAPAQKELDGRRFRFEKKSVYDLTPEHDRADLVICCEVLEHVYDPVKALAALHGLKAPRYLFSVPREPLWRVMNMVRLKYLSDLGNTPGHLNHWGRRGFLNFIGPSFEVLELRSPTPWTMVLCAPK